MKKQLTRAKIWAGLLVFCLSVGVFQIVTSAAVREFPLGLNVAIKTVDDAVVTESVAHIVKLNADINKDKQINEDDYNLLLGFVSKTNDPTSEELELADVEADGFLDIKDVTKFNSLLSGGVPTFSMYTVQFTFSEKYEAYGFQYEGEKIEFTNDLAIGETQNYTIATGNILIIKRIDNNNFEIAGIPAGAIGEPQYFNFLCTEIKLQDEIGNRVPNLSVSAVSNENKLISGGTSEVIKVKSDINKDGVINNDDYQLLLEFASFTKTPTDEEMDLADLNEDGMIDIIDTVIFKDIVQGNKNNIQIYDAKYTVSDNYKFIGFQTNGKDSKTNEEIKINESLSFTLDNGAIITITRTSLTTYIVEGIPCGEKDVEQSFNLLFEEIVENKTPEEDDTLPIEEDNAKPDLNGDTTKKPEKEVLNSKAPNTGDSINISGYVALIFISFISFIGLKKYQ